MWVGSKGIVVVRKAIGKMNLGFIRRYSRTDRSRLVGTMTRQTRGQKKGVKFCTQPAGNLC